MGFNFRMKHEGEPPARLIAQLRMRLKEHGQPPMFANIFAPIMESADDLDAETLAQITALVSLLEREGVAGEEAMNAITEVVEELMAHVDDEDDEGEDGDDLTAWLQSKRGNPQKKTLPQMVAEKIRAKRPKVRINGKAPHGRGIGAGNRGFTSAEGVTQTRAALSDALQARIDRKHQPTVGAQFAHTSLADMLMIAQRASGHRPLNQRDAIRMAGAHTTSDFPLILEDALGKTIGRQLEQVAPALMRAAHEIQSDDYRGGNLLSLSGSGMPREIPESGAIPYVTIDEKGELKPSPRDFGAMFHLSNKAIANDDLGVFNEISKKMVAGSVERLRHTLLEPLKANGGLGHNMADGKPMFHADHANLAAAGAALNLTSLDAARLALRSQRGSQGEYYAIEPWALVVPPQLETTAQQLLAEINATKTADVNPFSGTLELIVEVGLTDPKAWYLIGNPSMTDGLALSFLEGQNAPRVEAKPGWSTLGTEFRLIWALDARFVSHASWYKNPGA